MSKNEQEVEQYLKRVQLRYRRAKKKDKQKILDEFCAGWGYHRKYAITLLKGKKKKKASKKKGPARKYAGLVVDILRAIWNAAGWLCSKRLKAAIPLFFPWYKKEHHVSEEVEKKLLKISRRTIDRVLKPFRLQRKGKGLCSTRPGSLLKSQIPIKTDNWDVTQPGYLEADTVAHCGESLAGDFIYTVNCVDIFSGWVEQRAIWNKGQEGTLEAIRDIERFLPFELKGFDCDNGSEFLNHYLWKYCRERPEGKKVQFTRSRPYKKNDNAHIEQKNWTHVRQLLGYARLDRPELVKMLNDLYKQEWNWYVNFFCPSVKLVSKRRVGSKMVKLYDEPKTPFQRLLESKALSVKDVLRLKLRMKGLNPFELNERITRKVNQILDLVR
jgi:hypothetical protein